MTQHHPDEVIAQAAKARSAVDINEIVACVLREFDGAKGLAEKLRVDYDNLHDKSPSRERILSNIMKLICQAPPPPQAALEEGDELAAVKQELKESMRDARELD